MAKGHIVDTFFNRVIEGETDIPVKEQVSNIKVASQKLQYIINGSLDLTEIDAKDIKITDSIYNCVFIYVSQ